MRALVIGLLAAALVYFGGTVMAAGDAIEHLRSAGG